MKKERKKERSSGISLIEVLLAFLLLIIIVTGVSFGIIQLNQRIKQLELHRTARELIERIKSELSTYSYSNFSSLEIKYPNGTCEFSNGSLVGCSFEPDCYNSTYNFANCWSLTSPRCLYCLNKQNLEPASGNSPICNTGYPIRVGYSIAEVNIRPTEEDPLVSIGRAICVRVEFEDPISKENKAYYQLIFIKKDES
ncbi:MAG: hypothetical protein ACP5HI_06575 [Caldimicrobium sp.]